MVTAVLPRFFVDKQASQPQGSRVIDWSNPITRGLIGAFLPESPINFVDGEQMYQDWLPPTQSVKAQSEGKVLKNGIYTYQPSSVTFPYGYKFDLTQGAALLVASQSSAQNSNVGIGRASASGSQYWGIGLHGGTFNGAFGVWGTFNFTPSSGAAGLTLQKRTVIINADGSTATLYMDGGVVSSGAYTMPAYDSGYRNRCFAFGSTATGQTSNTATIEPSLGLVWNRPLTANEVALLTANPWQVFRRPQRAYTPLFDSTASPTSRTFFVPRRKVMSTQPANSMQIDWGNSITRGLVTAYVPTYSTDLARDLVSGAYDSAATRLSVGPGLNGVKGFNTGASTAWSLNFNWSTRWPHPNGVAPYPAVSVFTLFEQYDTTSIGSIFGGGTNNTNYARFGKESDGSIYFVPNTNTGSTSVIYGPVLDTNRVYALAGVNEGNYRELFVDAASVASANTTITFTNSQYTYAGSAYAASQFRRIGLYCGYVWTRRLTPSEIKSLSENPWQIFKQPRLSPALAEDGKVYAPFMS